MPGHIKSLCGLDGISLKLLKDGAENLALPLFSIVNLSIKQSLFLDQCMKIVSYLHDQCKITKLTTLTVTRKLQAHLTVTYCVYKNRESHSHSDARIFG